MFRRLRQNVILTRLGKILTFAILLIASIAAAQPLGVQAISTEAVAARLGKPGWVVVDVRNSNAYNGWKVGPERRGGHIYGAKNIAIDWFRDSRTGLAELASAKKLSNNRVILYGTTEQESQQMAEWLIVHAKVLPEKLFIYSGGFSAWSNNEQLPVDKLARYDKLVPPWWVLELLAREKKTDYRIVEVAWRKRDQYQNGHLPEAVYLDTDQLESKPLWNIVSPAQIEKELLSLGITKDTLVVVYGRDLTAAARAACVMMYAGVTDVRLLNGGFQAWLDAGYAVDQTHVTITAATEFGAAVPVHPEWIVGSDGAKAILSEPDGRLVSTRSWAEYIGQTSGYAYIQNKGRIRGARWGRLDRDAAGMEDFRNPDNTLRQYNEIESRWREADIFRNHRVCFYCGTGWRASEAFFSAYVMGFERISVFDGGWYEWSSNANNPVAHGPPILDERQPEADSGGGPK